MMPSGQLSIRFRRTGSRHRSTADTRNIVTILGLLLALAPTAPAAGPESVPRPSPEEFIGLLYEERVWVVGM